MVHVDVNSRIARAWSKFLLCLLGLIIFFRKVASLDIFFFFSLVTTVSVSAERYPWEVRPIVEARGGGIDEGRSG